MISSFCVSGFLCVEGADIPMGSESTISVLKSPCQLSTSYPLYSYSELLGLDVLKSGNIGVDFKISKKKLLRNDVNCFNFSGTMILFSLNFPLQFSYENYRSLRHFSSVSHELNSSVLFTSIERGCTSFL